MDRRCFTKFIIVFEKNRQKIDTSRLLHSKDNRSNCVDEWFLFLDHITPFGGRSTSGSDHIGGSDTQPRIRSHYWNLIHPIPYPKGSDHMIQSMKFSLDLRSVRSPQIFNDSAFFDLNSYPIDLKLGQYLYLEGKGVSLTTKVVTFPAN
eukprot:sb/3473628/